MNLVFVVDNVFSTLVFNPQFKMISSQEDAHFSFEICATPS